MSESSELFKVNVDGWGNVDISIQPDGKFYWAEGVLLDYGSQGDTPEEAKSNFKEGLESTIRLNLEKFGSLTNFKKHFVRRCTCEDSTPCACGNQSDPIGRHCMYCCLSIEDYAS